MKDRVSKRVGGARLVAAALLLSACGGSTSLGGGIAGANAGGAQGVGGGSAGNSAAESGYPATGQQKDGGSSLPLDDLGASGAAASASSGGAAAMPYPTCAATCADAAGTVQPLSTFAAFYAVVVGKWLTCAAPGAVFPGPADVIGVEFGAPSPLTGTPGVPFEGNMYLLVQGASGPERGAGFDYELMYDVSGNGDPGAPAQLNMHPTPKSGYGGSFRYAPCPEELEIHTGVHGGTPGFMLVRVP